MAAPPVVDVRDLRRSYGERQALAGVSFDVRDGEIFGLLGPNGGGKTTLLRILATLLPPSSGSAAVFGLDVSGDAGAVRRRIGVVFQSKHVDGKLTAAENLRHHGHLYGLRGRELKERIERSLTRFGLTDRQSDLVETLSGGLRRRLELAKGLLHQPGLLLLDEPSTGLDPGARRDLWDHLMRLRGEAANRSLTVIVSTHLLDEAERCDRLVILNQGQIVAAGSPDALKGEIGAEVILVETSDPQRILPLLKQRFAVEASIVGGKIRFEHPRGHEFILQLVEAFPGEIQSATVSKPTLEDVFLHRTGHQFWDAATVPARN
jgi:ABC-2 type transport system ATP-binding protein